MADVVRLFDYERRSRNPDAAPERFPVDADVIELRPNRAAVLPINQYFAIELGLLARRPCVPVLCGQPWNNAPRSPPISLP